MPSKPQFQSQPQPDSQSSNKNKPNFELLIVNAWQKKSWWLWLFLPISWLYGIVIFIKKKLYQSKVLKTYRAPVPVMIVGNITVGGSGKTPLIIELVRFLQSKDIQVGVISRGYGGDEATMPSLVTVSSTPEQVGDEPCLIVRETGVMMSVSPNRQRAIECLLNAAPDIQLIIADDGLQHYKLERDIEWIVVDSDRGFGNGQLLPVGFLREPLSRLDGATVIYHQLFNGNQQDFYANSTLSSESNLDSSVESNVQSNPQPNQQSDPQSNWQSNSTHHFNPVFNKENDNDNANNNLVMTLVPSQLKQLNEFTDDILLTSDSQPIVYAVSGIGYPKRFFKTLISLGFEVIERPMPDHHSFTVADLDQLTDHPIIITSKDAVKIAPLIEQNPSLNTLSIWVLPVQALLTKKCYQTLLKQLHELGIVS